MNEDFPSLDQCSPLILEKAQALLLSQSVREVSVTPMEGWPSARKYTYRVTGSKGNSYKVAAVFEKDDPVWVSCNCPHGMNSTRYDVIGCYHQAAVFMYRAQMT